ncbi:hypothetical protein BY996DRAFT_2753565 [Phakopsora pachyrhizi]|nr:hypothetical protein BY996DRAFT_2753565 [Phakopsora pachyrhizi]
MQSPLDDFEHLKAYLDGPVANDENLKKSGNSSPVAKPLATVTSPAPSSLQSSQASIPISSVEKLPRSPLGHKVQDTESTSSDLRAKVRDSDEDQEGVEDMLFALSLAYGETPNSETEEKPIERKELSTSNSVLPRSPSSLTPIPSKLSDEDSKIEILATPAAPPKTSFPSTFAAGKKSAARLAAAQAAQAADKAASNQPGRKSIGHAFAGKKNKAPVTWNSDSDEEDEDEEQDDDEEDDDDNGGGDDERLTKHRQSQLQNLAGTHLSDKGMFTP